MTGTDFDSQPRSVAVLDLGGNNEKTQMGMGHLSERIDGK